MRTAVKRDQGKTQPLIEMIFCQKIGKKAKETKTEGEGNARTKLFKFLLLGHACPPTFRWHRSGMRVGLDATVCLRGSLPSRIAESQPYLQRRQTM